MEILVQTLAHWKNEYTLEFTIKNEFDGIEIVEGLFRNPEEFNTKLFEDYKETFDLIYLYHVSPQFFLGDIRLICHKALLRQIENSLKVCNELEIPFITVHVFHYGSGLLSRKMRRKSYELVVEGVKEILKKAIDYNIKLSLEIGPNWDRETMNKCLTIKHLIRVVKETDSDFVKITYDAEHAYSTGTPPFQGLKKSIKYISYVHASDNDYSKTHMHLPLGKGKFPWKEMIEYLKRKKKCPIVIENTKEEDIIESKKFLLEIIK